jgi:TonB-linked SusC/RagA family outer membrane protein
MRLQFYYCTAKCRVLLRPISTTFKLIILLLLFSASAFAQKKITGVVKDADGKPIFAITVSIKGTTTGTLTDTSGRFNLSASPGNTLVFTGISYDAVEMVVDTRTEYNITLKGKSSGLQEVIIIGYGATTKADVTGSVAKASVENMQKAPVRSFDEAMAGRVAGVNVSSVDGQPGSAVNIVIRGANSVTQDNSPLYVVDGFPLENPNNNFINPLDIASIEVLKDASATAIYGSRGANGVIIITTKKGKVGPPVVSLNTSVGFQENIKTMAVMSPYEFVKYQLERDVTTATSTYFTNGKTLDSYRDVPTIDWQGELFRPALIQNHSLSVSGGNSSTRYYISGNVLGQDGTIINSSYKRYQGSMSLDQTFSSKVKGGVYVNHAYNNQSGISPSTVANGSNTTATLFSVWGYRNFAISGVPDLEDALFDPGVDPTVDFRINPVINQQHLLRQNLYTNTVVNTYLEYMITPDLKLRITAGINKTIGQNNQFNDTSTVYGNKHTMVGSLNGVNGSVLFSQNSTWINENTLTYTKIFARDHSLTLLGGMSESGNKSSSYGSGATNLPNPQLGISGLNEGTPQTVNALTSSWGLVSFLSRADYKYKSKYLLTVSFRADGSSKFAKENRWGYFPSGALAWRFTEEGFMKKFNALSDGKLRVSYGVTGNNRVGDYAYLSSIGIAANSQGYTFGNTTISGAFPSNLGNAGLKWETTSSVNIGTDLSFIKNRISLTAEVYRKKTTDLLLLANLPLSLGYSQALRNIGSVQNQGLELTLNTVNIKNRSFGWESSFNISFNQSKILSLSENQAAITSAAPFDFYYRSIPAYISKVGNQLGMMYGYIFDGLYQYADFDKTASGGYILKDNIPTNGNLRSSIAPGDMKFKDINGDRVIDANDYAIIGRGLPIHTGGFNNNFRYKNFDLNMFMQWSYGNDIINANRYIFEGNTLGRSNLNQFASFENRWTPTNTNTTIHRGGPGGAGPSTPTGTNSSVIEDGSYLRLKTVALGYTLPQNLMKRLGLKTCRVYASAQNLYTWTKYSGIDPEVSVFNSVLTPGVDYSAYPRPRTITLGVNMSF